MDRPVVLDQAGRQAAAQQPVDGGLTSNIPPGYWDFDFDIWAPLVGKYDIQTGGVVTYGSPATNVFAGTPGFLRFDPKTRLSEFYAIPKEGIGVRGGDIDKNGVLWGSGSNGTLIFKQL